MKSFIFLCGFLFSAFLFSMEAETELNRLLNEIIIHTPGGVGIKNDVNNNALSDFLAQTSGIAYFKLSPLGFGFTELVSSSREFNPQEHKFAVVVGDSTISDEWKLDETRGNIKFFRKKEVEITQEQLLEFLKLFTNSRLKN